MAWIEVVHDRYILKQPCEEGGEEKKDGLAKGMDAGCALCERNFFLKKNFKNGRFDKTRVLSASVI